MAAAVAVPLILGGVSTALSAAGAMAQNRATARAMKSQQEAAGIQSRQLSDQASAERAKRIREADATLGALRVGRVESGLSVGSFSDLFTQANQDRMETLRILDQNLFNQQELVRSGAQANLAELSARIQNPLLSAFQGAIQGVSTGLQITSAYQSIGALNAAQKNAKGTA